MKMMDLKDIIKWLLPCFHILLLNMKLKRYFRVAIFCLFLFFNPCAAGDDNILGVSDLIVNKVNLNNHTSNDAKYIHSEYSVNHEKYFPIVNLNESSSGRSAESRTFGRPLMKKLMTAIIPLAFQIGAASTWAVVAAIIGFKTLLVTLVILKLMIMAGAAKFGSLVFHKQEHQAWAPQHQNKEIHLHIHNTPQGVHEQVTDWNRDGATAATEQKLATQPYAPAPAPAQLGPETIVTPFGNYVKVGPGTIVRKRRRVKNYSISERNKV